MSPTRSSLVLPSLLIGASLGVAAAAAVGQCGGPSCPGAAGDDESAMIQLKAPATLAGGGASFNFSSFHLGDWPSISATCAGGSGTGFQSPINIAVEGAEYKKMNGPTFYAKDGGCQGAFFVDKGTTWQVDFYDPQNGGVNCTNLRMEIEGKVYVLAQLHFHTLSEDTLDFKPFPMQMHMVHIAADNTIAVVGVFIHTHGPAFYQNPFLKTVFDIGFSSDRKETFPGDGTFNPYESMLSKWGEFWHYRGSLTTPPCTEGLDFYIAKDPMLTSADNVAGLVDHLKANGLGNSYGHNNRPIQPLDGRDISTGNWNEVCSKKKVPDCGDLDPVFCHFVEKYA